MSDVDFMDRPHDDDDREGLVDAQGAALTDPVAERQLLGRLLSNPVDVMFVSDLQGSVFSDAIHRRMFDALKSKFERDEQISIVSIVDALGGDAKAVLPFNGGLTLGQYYAHLIVEADLSIDVEALADHLFDVAERRAYSQVADEEFDANVEFKSRMGLKMWVDQNDPAEDYEYLVEDLIPQNEGCLLIGETQTGKSFLTFHLAMCGARGVPFFGRRILKPFWTIWFAHEAARGQTARMRAYRRHHGLDLDHLPFAVLTKPMALWPDPNAIAATIAEIKGIVRSKFRGVEQGLIVFDTYNAATPGASEIDSEVVSRIRGGFDRIRGETRATTLIVGHTNAAGKHRGNEQLTNNIDTVIVVSRKMRTISAREVIEEKDDDGRAIRTMKVKKQREGVDGEEHDFVLHVVEDGTKNRYGKARTSCVVGPANIADAPMDDRADVKGERHVGAKVTRQDALFLECLLETVDSVGVPAPGDLRLSRSIAKVVDYDHVKRLMSKKMLNEEDNTEDGLKKHRAKAKQAVSRARERLQQLKVVGCEKPFIWWTGKPVRGIGATQPRDRNLFDNPQLSDDDISGLY